MTDPNRRVRLSRWNAEDALQRAAGLDAFGDAADFGPFAPEKVRITIRTALFGPRELFVQSRMGEDFVERAPHMCAVGINSADHLRDFAGRPKRGGVPPEREQGAVDGLEHAGAGLRVDCADDILELLRHGIASAMLSSI